MKFSIGYHIFDDSRFINEIIALKKDISEVYFSWGAFPNGRNNQINNAMLAPWEAQQKQISDLKLLNDSGIKFNLLFNSMCYGAESQSKALFEKIGETVDYIISNYNLSSVTTTSILIAKFMKANFSCIDVRASVNMCIGSIEGMSYVQNYFDSFYIKRELNHDFAVIEKLKSWCDNNGKRLYALANSGCLNNCSAHVFHDNLVAHENEIANRNNGYQFKGICNDYLKEFNNKKDFFCITNFIRPEDICLYDNLFQSFKLATRMSNNPCAILDGYVRQKHYNGNILDLLEPNHSAAFYPWIIDNEKISSKVENKKLIYGNIEESMINLDESL